MTNDKLKQLDDIDEKEIQAEIGKSIQKLQSYTTHLINFKYNLLIYKLLKNNYLSDVNLARASGLSRQRLYQIMRQFEDKEIERDKESELAI